MRSSPPVEGKAPNAKSILCQYDDSTCIEVGLDIEKVIQEYLSLRFGYTALATEQDNTRWLRHSSTRNLKLACATEVAVRPLPQLRTQARRGHRPTSVAGTLS